MYYFMVSLSFLRSIQPIFTTQVLASERHLKLGIQQYPRQTYPTLWELLYGKSEYESKPRNKQSKLQFWQGLWKHRTGYVRRGWTRGKDTVQGQGRPDLSSESSEQEHFRPMRSQCKSLVVRTPLAQEEECDSAGQGGERRRVSGI